MTESRETPPDPSAAMPPPRRNHGLEDYHRIADTIGGVPNLRWKDNLFQTAAVAVFAILGGVIGWLFISVKDMDLWMRIALGVLAGLVVGVFLSGFTLMILGWIRSGKRR